MLSVLTNECAPRSEFNACHSEHMFWSWFVWDQVQQKLVQINFKCDLNNKKKRRRITSECIGGGSVLLAGQLMESRGAAHMHAAAAQRAGGAAAL